jgi:hypothetical protein
MYPLCSLHEIQIFPKKPKLAKIGQKSQNWPKKPKLAKKAKFFKKKAKKAKFAKKPKLSKIWLFCQILAFLNFFGFFWKI